MGKVIGGGLPAAAFGGRVELMERIAPAGDVYQAGTLSGNPLAVAAGLAALRMLDDVAYARLAATTSELAGGLREAAGDRPVQVVALPGLVTTFFSAEPVEDYAGAAACDLEAYGRGAAACSPAASIRRRRSSRPGSPRSPTPPSTWHAPSRPPLPRSGKSR